MTSRGGRERQRGVPRIAATTQIPARNLRIKVDLPATSMSSSIPGRLMETLRHRLPLQVGAAVAVVLVLVLQIRIGGVEELHVGALPVLFACQHRACMRACARARERASMRARMRVGRVRRDARVRSDARVGGGTRKGGRCRRCSDPAVTVSSRSLGGMPAYPSPPHPSPQCSQLADRDSHRTQLLACDESVLVRVHLGVVAPLPHHVRAPIAS